MKLGIVFFVFDFKFWEVEIGLLLWVWVNFILENKMKKKRKSNKNKKWRGDICKFRWWNIMFLVLSFRNWWVWNKVIEVRYVVCLNKIL